MDEDGTAAKLPPSRMTKRHVEKCPMCNGGGLIMTVTETIEQPAKHVAPHERNAHEDPADC